jgi:hypothetical protein
MFVMQSEKCGPKKYVIIMSIKKRIPSNENFKNKTH